MAAASQPQSTDLLTKFTKLFKEGKEVPSYTPLPSPPPRSDANQAANISAGMERKMSTAPWGEEEDGGNNGKEEGVSEDPPGDKDKKMKSINRTLAITGSLLGLIVIGVVVGTMVSLYLRKQKQAQLAQDPQLEIEKKQAYHDKNVDKVTSFVNRVHQTLSGGSNLMGKKEKANKKGKKQQQEQQQQHANSEGNGRPASTEGTDRPAYTQPHPGMDEVPAPAPPSGQVNTSSDDTQGLYYPRTVKNDSQRHAAPTSSSNGSAANLVPKPDANAPVPNDLFVADP
jgi:hypothetical protein